MTDKEEMVARDYRLLEMLKQHIVQDAMVILESDEYWEEHEGFNKQEFEEVITRCRDGNGTNQDWNWLKCRVSYNTRIYQ